MKNNKAFTLIELMISLSIIGLLLGVALPQYGKFVDRNKIKAESMQLRVTLQLGRKTAISEYKKVTICPSNSNTCSKNWSEGYIAFIDLNEDRQLNADEKLLYRGNVDDDIKLRFRAFGRTSSFQWHQTGITNHQNGTFEFCFKQDPKLSRALIVSKAGRVKISKDTNNDGIHENARGVNIAC